MELPLQITWRDVDSSEALEATIRRHAEKLREFATGITKCHVVVGKSQGRHRQGNLYSIHLEIHVPGQPISITRDPGDEAEHEDMYVVVRDTFQAAYKRLKQYSDKRQQQVKHHERRRGDREAD